MCFSPAERMCFYMFLYVLCFFCRHSRLFDMFRNILLYVFVTSFCQLYPPDFLYIMPMSTSGNQSIFVSFLYKVQIWLPKHAQNGGYFTILISVFISDVCPSKSILGCREQAPLMDFHGDPGDLSWICHRNEILGVRIEDGPPICWQLLIG